MEHLLLRPDNIKEVAARAAAVCRAGGVVLYPTDTLYGLGADALSDEAVAKIYEIKARDTSKPIHAIVGSLEMAARYAEIPEVVERIAAHAPWGKVAFICKKAPGLESGICRGIDTFGFRVPESDLCAAISRAFGKPYTATSANTSGASQARRVEEIVTQLKARSAGIDLVIDAGELPASAPSTIVDVTHETPVIVREGAVPASKIEPFLRD
ncbi:MAG: hypothetical protein RLZZ416_621 [Candidatus Parcubacteria bacterium]|jgi:L-threonylcarbamoyladenylate synthase